MPIGATPEDVKRARVTLSELAEAAGRDPNSISITIFGQPPEKDLIQQVEEAGADRVVLLMMAEDQESLLADVEEKARAVLG